MKKHLTFFLVFASILLSLTAPAWAGSVSFKFTKPDNRTDSKVTIGVKKSNGDIVDTTKVTITPGMTAEQKRDAIKAALEAKGYTVTSTGGGTADPGITISAIRDGRKVYFSPGSTGEKADTETASSSAFSSIAFEGTFNSTDWNDRPATFTAGVTTAYGEVKVEYRAIDFSPGDEIDGAWIAERLFGDLVGPASDLGALLELKGHEIQVFFDSPGTNGVIFGTTSPGEGLSGGGDVGLDVEEVPTSDPLPDHQTEG